MIVQRRIEPLAGRPRTTVRIRPGFDYGSVVPSISVGSNHVRFIGENTVLRLTTDMSLSYLVHETDMVLDRPANLFLSADEPIPENPDALAREFRDETVQYWQDWVRGLSVPFDWQDEVVRAAMRCWRCFVTAAVASLECAIVTPSAHGLPPPRSQSASAA